MSIVRQPLESRGVEVKSYKRITAMSPPYIDDSTVYVLTLVCLGRWVTVPAEVILPIRGCRIKALKRN
jgi:hypothetical protein